jgi:hypothetical protein
MHTKFWLENPSGRGHFDGLVIDGCLVDVQEIGCEKNDLSLIINVRITKKARKILSAVAVAVFSTRPTFRGTR